MQSILALATPALESDYDSRLAELFAAGQSDEACELVQNYLASGVEANCWLAKDSGTSQPYGEVATPGSGTVNCTRFGSSGWSSLDHQS